MNSSFVGAEEVDHLPVLPMDTTSTIVAYPSLMAFGVTRTWAVAADEPRAWYAGGSFGLPMTGMRWDMVYGRQGNTTLWDWPLTDGKTWSTRVAGASMEMTAERLDASGRFEVTGHLDDGSPVLVYRYDPEVRWYTHLRILDRDGSRLLAVELVDQGASFDGTAYRGGGGTLGSCTASGGPTGIGECRMGSLATEDGQTWFYHDLFVDGPGPGTFTAARKGPDDTVHDIRFREECPCEIHRTWFVEPDQGPGMYEWQIDHAFTGEWRFAYSSANPCFDVLAFEDGEMIVQGECPYPG